MRFAATPAGSPPQDKSNATASGYRSFGAGRADVERSAEWYQNVLGLTRFHQEVWGSFPAVLGVGTTSVDLFPVGTPDPLPPPGRTTLAVRHIAFRIGGADFDCAQAELQRREIPFEFQDHEIAHSIYFQDPDGHQLEITTYELLRSTT